MSERTLTDAFVALGSNLGARERHLRGAVTALAEAPGIQLVAASPVYESPAHTLAPDQVQPPFLNAVVHIRTAIPPDSLLELLLSVEREAGRMDGPRWDPRPLDLDLLLYGDVQQAPAGEDELALPHPRLAERRFVLQPLADLVPDLKLPGGRATVTELLARCPDEGPLARTTISLLASAPRLPDTLRYVAVEGVIGAGKTSLARMLAERMAGKLVLEEFEENPFLPDFYRNPDRWAFHTQLSFLASRFRQQKTLIARDLFHQRTVSDYTFDKDRIFAHITLSGDELQLYETVYTLMEPATATPDLVVYLQSSADRLMHNIERRGRTYERNMQRGYIEELAGAYDHYFRHYTKGPLLIVKSSAIDFVNNPDDFERLVTRVGAMAGQGGTSVFEPPASLELKFS